MSPFVAAVALPFAVALVLYGVGTRVGALRDAAPWAALCAGLGFLTGYFALEGLPPWMPVASKQKIFHLVLGALGVGAALTWARPASARVGAGAALGLAAAAWVGQRKLGDAGAWIPCVLLALWGGVAVRVAMTLDPRGAPSALVPFVAVGGGVAAIALSGASASLSLLAAAVAATAGAMALAAGGAELLEDAPRRLGSAAPTVLATALAAIAAALVWFTPKVDTRALALAALAPLAGLLVSRLPLRLDGRIRRAVEPVLVLAACGLPVGIAVLLASRSALQP